jgi:hypothetical protein
MRGRGMKRCRAEGAERFGLFVGAAVLANNLMIVAALLSRLRRRNCRKPRGGACLIFPNTGSGSRLRRR